MTTPQGPLNALFPEIYPVIAGHLSLNETPSTLFALALTNRNISEMVLPLLYSRLVLKNETDAVRVLQKLIDDPPFGRVVRELHIMTARDEVTQNPDPPLGVIRRVQDVITRGYLPFIHTLDLQLVPNWYMFPDDLEHLEHVKGFEQLGKELWTQLKDNCPRLRALILKGFACDLYEPWFDGSEDLNITTLVYWFGPYMYRGGYNKFFGHISLLAPSLHTLELGQCPFRLTPTSLIFGLELPFLRSLSLTWFTEVDVAQSMAFFERHPNIEYLNILTNDIANWFTSELPPNFLPNLRHLRAKWSDIQLLSPILKQLSSLSVHGVNVQIVSRCFLPNEFPNLKRLDIGQMVSAACANGVIGGSLLIRSIVHAAPNLEELGFHRSLLHLCDLLLIADDLNGFPHLKHLYYDGDDISLSTKQLKAFTRDLAEAVQELLSITNLVTLDRPYLTARVVRKKDGEVTDIEIGKGYGTKIGYDVDAFPWTALEFD